MNPRRTMLTAREREVVRLQEAGMTLRQTAAALGIAPSTVNQLRVKAANRRVPQRELTRRQREVVSCLALGLTVEETADKLGIARGTAVHHRTLAGLALGLRSTVELTHYAIVHGWVGAGDPLSPERLEAALRRVAARASTQAAKGPGS